MISSTILPQITHRAASTRCPPSRINSGTVKPAQREQGMMTSQTARKSWDKLIDGRHLGMFYRTNRTERSKIRQIHVTFVRHEIWGLEDAGRPSDYTKTMGAVDEDLTQEVNKLVTRSCSLRNGMERRSRFDRVRNRARM